MKKVKILIATILCAALVVKLNAYDFVRLASAQDLPDLQSITEIEQSDAKDNDHDNNGKNKDNNGNGGNSSNNGNSSSSKYSKPTDDARVTESDPRVNYGKSKYLGAGRWKKGKVESYIKFKTRSGYHATKLYIYLVSGKTSGLTVYSSSTNWSEKKITWRNRPSKGSKLDSSAKKSGSWWEFDVSGARSNGGYYSFAITGPSNKIVNIYSKEGKHAPRLAFEKGSDNTPKPTSKTSTPHPTSGSTETPGATATPGDSSTPNPSATCVPGVDCSDDGSNNTPEPSPTCDPGIDCGNDGDPGTGGIVIDESDDGAVNSTPGPSCAPGIDCTNDGGPTTAPTCAPGIDCGNDGGPTGNPTGTPASSPTCAPGIDCGNDGGPTNTPIPTTSNRSTNPTPTQQASSTPVTTPGGGTGGINPTMGTKIAYIGDTGDGNNFQGVLNLIKQEGATAVMHSGDLSYTSSASTFISKINATLGANYPYFMGEGNHDTGSWSQYVPRIPSQYVVAGDPKTANYAVNFNGIYIAIGKDKIQTPSTFSQDLKLAQVQNIWKVCSFHEVNRAMHTGYKSTEIPYSVYDECRTYGAMTTNGHAHTYDRTVTLTSASGQSTDPAFPDPFTLRVARGIFFDLHSGAGGRDPGTWERCHKTTDASDVAGGKCDIFANRNGNVITRTGNPYGAAFITYGVNGDPRKATGYYMEVGSSAHIDDFTITAQ